MQNKDLGMLLLRFGVGLAFLWFGVRALLAGSSRWVSLGANLRSFGVDFWPEVWGIVITLAAVFGGICILAGLLFRLACLTLAIGTVFAIYLGFNNAGFPVDAVIRGLLVAGLAFAGPGRYSLGR